MIIHVVTCHAEGEVGDVIVGPSRPTGGSDRLPDRAPDHDRRPDSHYPDNFRPGLDCRHQSVYGRPRRSWPSGYRLSDTWPRIREAI
jgi:proline racemase